MGIVLLVGATAIACISDPTPNRHTEGSLAGLTLSYQFDNGRVYQAAYGEDTVRFELLEPSSPTPTSATLPYREERLREGLFLVVWDDPDFHTTFVVDLVDRTLHASAMRSREGSFLGTARILSIATPPRSSPEELEAHR